MPESGALRLFFALWPDAALRERLWRDTAALRKAGGGRPVARDNLHLTLAFLGSVPPADLPALRSAAAQVQAPDFDLVLDTADYWKRPQLLVLAPSVVAAPLAGLASQLWQALSPLGFVPEARTFRPHVTLARRARDPGLQALAGPLCWPVREFCLVRSVTDSGGARYEPLARYHLVTRA